MSDVCYNGGIGHCKRDALVSDVLKISKGGIKMKEMIRRNFFTIAPENVEVLEGLKTATYAAYIDGVRFVALMAAICSVCFGIACGFIWTWSWQALGNLFLQGCFCAVCVAMHMLIPPAEDYFLKEELRYFDARPGQVIAFIIEGLLLILAVAMIIAIAVLGWISSLPVFLGWAVFKITLIAGCWIAVHRSISF